MLYDPQTAEPQPTSPLLESLIKMQQFLSDPQNWTKGTFQTPEGQCCLLGAYGKVHNIPRLAPEDYVTRVMAYPPAKDVVNALHKALCPESKSYEHRVRLASVWIYNDSQQRTHEEIMALLDKAIQAEATALREKETVDVH